LGLVGPIFYLLYDKYVSSVQIKTYPIDKILMCVLAAILSAIFTAGRDNRTPTLSFNNSKQAGYQFVNLIVSFGFSIVFGLLAGFLLKCITVFNE
jgi:hypothetical protein